MWLQAFCASAPHRAVVPCDSTAFLFYHQHQAADAAANDDDNATMTMVFCDETGE